LAFYVEHFHTVEVDSIFYACPSARTVCSIFVRDWNPIKKKNPRGSP
jgi:Protein of unknown function DUF72